MPEQQSIGPAAGCFCKGGGGFDHSGQVVGLEYQLPLVVDGEIVNRGLVNKSVQPTQCAREEGRVVSRVP